MGSMYSYLIFTPYSYNLFPTIFIHNNHTIFRHYGFLNWRLKEVFYDTVFQGRNFVYWFSNHLGSLFKPELRYKIKLLELNYTFFQVWQLAIWAGGCYWNLPLPMNPTIAVTDVISLHYIWYSQLVSFTSPVKNPINSTETINWEYSISTINNNEVNW